MIEIRIGKAVFPVIGIAKTENDDLLIVFLNGVTFWGQSVKTGLLAPFRFKGGKTVWGGKVVKFI